MEGPPGGPAVVGPSPHCLRRLRVTTDSSRGQMASPTHAPMRKAISQFVFLRGAPRGAPPVRGP
ncbi:hypothetical protein ACSSS7_004575 [Eimeria intestinalis]